MSPIIRTCARRILSQNRQGPRKYIGRAPDRRRVDEGYQFPYLTVVVFGCQISLMCTVLYEFISDKLSHT